MGARGGDSRLCPAAARRSLPDDGVLPQPRLGWHSTASSKRHLWLLTFPRRGSPDRARLWRAVRYRLRLSAAVIESTGGRMPLFAVIRTRGSAWRESQPLEGQPEWTSHASFMNA